MTPGKYIALRRAAAGLDQATAQYDFGNVVARQKLTAVRSIEQIEADAGTLTVAELVALSTIFDLDANVVLTLVMGAAPMDGTICRVCGCSWDDPCDPPCGWAEGGCTSDTTALCTACDDGVGA